MPLTKISAPKHLSTSQVQALAAAVHDGLVNTCNVPPDELFQLVSRVEPDEMLLDPHYGGVNRSRDACVIEIVLLGRTDDKKRALFRHVTDQAAKAGFREDDVMIVLVENALMNWCLGHGIPYADQRAKAKAAVA